MASSAPSRGRLLRVLGVWFGLAVVVGNTIGAGILRTPGDVARELPTRWAFLAVWVGGALYALLGTNSVAELGAALPRSGGQYVFSRRALGPYAGFVVGWSDWISTCGTAAAVSIAIGDVGARLLPSLAGRQASVALFVLALLTIVQWRGVKWGGRVQEVTSLAKAVAFLALVAACFLVPARGTVSAAPAMALGGHLAGSLVAWMIALQSVIYTYDGWNGAVYFGDEVKDPGRAVPRAMFGGVLAVAVIYLLVNLAFLHVLPMRVLAASNLPAAVAARAVFGPAGDVIVSALMVVSLLSAVNAYVLMAPRVLYTMAGDGLAIASATTVNSGGTPTVALLVSSVVSALFLAGGAFDAVIAVVAYFFVANYVLSFVSLIALRRNEPELERPFRAIGYPWTNALALLGAVVFLVGAVVADPRHSLVAVGLLVASYPVYRLTRAMTARRETAPPA